jgi:hypothetical protein
MIINCLNQWYKGKRPAINLLPTDDDEPNATLQQFINEAYHDQCNIGWGHFLRGRIAKTWRELSHITNMKEDQAVISTQHIGPKRPSTKYGQHFAPFGSAETESYTGKTMKNNAL